KVKRFSAATMQQGLKLVREELGADAMILSTRKADGVVEIMAALNFSEEELRNQAPEPVRAKSTAELIKLETDKHRQLQDELERSRQRIAAVRQSNVRPTPEPIWPELAADEVNLASAQAAKKTASKDGQTLAKRQISGAAEAATSVAANVGSGDALAEMRSEIMQLKDLLTRQLAGQTNENQRELENRLSRMGVFPELQKKL